MATEHDQQPAQAAARDADGAASDDDDEEEDDGPVILPRLFTALTAAAVTLDLCAQLAQDAEDLEELDAEDGFAEDLAAARDELAEMVKHLAGQPDGEVPKAPAEGSGG